jgi:hypothetical protein
MEPADWPAPSVRSRRFGLGSSGGPDLLNECLDCLYEVRQGFRLVEEGDIKLRIYVPSSSISISGI